MRTGLEPATLGVTGRYSNQLNYRTVIWIVVRFELNFPRPWERAILLHHNNFELTNTLHRFEPLQCTTKFISCLQALLLNIIYPAPNLETQFKDKLMERNKGVEPSPRPWLPQCCLEFSITPIPHWAGKRNRTVILGLGSLCTSRCAIPALCFFGNAITVLRS